MELPEVSLKDITLQDQQGKEDAQEATLLRDLVELPDAMIQEKVRVDVNVTESAFKFVGTAALQLHCWLFNFGSISVS